jgi:glycosyltransferase involved in cell wall biosynthesis
MFCDYSYDEREPNKQGIYARLPGLKTPYTEIPNGYDAAKWKCTAPKQKNTFITVANGFEYGFQQSLKGIDLIFAVAPFFTDCEFIVLGVVNPAVFSVQLPNVKVLPPAKNDELISVFSGCEFYMQLSMAEGFPNALCEAMLCECIPIGSEVFSIPEIIGDSGFVLKKRNTQNLTQLIKQALIADKEVLRKKARARIEDNYALANRQIKLAKLCAALVA